MKINRFKRQNVGNRQRRAIERRAVSGDPSDPETERARATLQRIWRKQWMIDEQASQEGRAKGNQVTHYFVFCPRCGERWVSYIFVPCACGNIDGLEASVEDGPIGHDFPGIIPVLKLLLKAWLAAWVVATTDGPIGIALAFLILMA